MLTNGIIRNSKNNNEEVEDDEEKCFRISKRRKRLTLTSCKTTDPNQVSYASIC